MIDSITMTSIIRQYLDLFDEWWEQDSHLCVQEFVASDSGIRKIDH